MFDARSDRADDRAFADRCKDDRHHFRFIVSPEDAGEMTDLKAFTRDLDAADGSAISARGSTGLPSITGTPTTLMSIFSYAAWMMPAPTW